MCPLSVLGSELNSGEMSRFLMSAENISEAVDEVEGTTAFDSANAWGNLIPSLSPWQRQQLSLVDSNSGVRCLLRMWLTVQTTLAKGTYCNATWDQHYCWPPTPSGSVIKRNCSEVLLESHPQYASYLKGHAFRICQQDGTWLKGNWTNYTECADSYDEYVEDSIMQAEENELKEKVRYTVFIGSILSLVCLFTAISIFCCFRSIWCDRIVLHIHLMAALMVRYVLLYVITEPFIFDRTNNYRDEDWICKAVLVLYLYATLSSVNWMFIQGVYLNSKLTTNIFDEEPPFKFYYTFGWLVPVPFLGIYTLFMEANHPVKCWKGYSEMDEIWIILGPILADLVINVCFLLNILRILFTKVHRTTSYSNAGELKHFKRAAKATIILSPILGINNLLFIYNPGGAYHKTFVLLNTFFGATQGVFVALVYCYLSSDVWSAVHRAYRRFNTRRNAGRCRTQHRYVDSNSTSNALNVGQQSYHYQRENTFTKSHLNNASTKSAHLSPASIPSPSHSESYRKPRRGNNNSSQDAEQRKSLLGHASSLGHLGDEQHIQCNPFLSTSGHPSLSEQEEDKEVVSQHDLSLPQVTRIEGV